MFFDLEANEDDGSGSSDEDEVEDGSSILRSPVEDEDSITDQGIRLAASNRARIAEEKAEDRQWDEFVDRAHARANSETSSSRILGPQSVGEVDAFHLHILPFLQEKTYRNTGEAIYKNISWSPSRVDWPWARVLGTVKKWRWYAGDTGLITRDDKYLALIPRLAILDDCEDTEKQSRPTQALVSRTSLEIRKAAKVGLCSEFVWKNQVFSAEGFLLVALDKIAILPLLEPLPSSGELDIFRSSSLLSTMEAERTERTMAQTRMKIGDRVKVVSGPYLDLIGMVREIKEYEVSVYLPSQDVVEDMPKSTLRAAFMVGDQVRVLDGKRKDLVGWVIEVSEGRLRIVHVESCTEVIVSKSEVEFHTPDHIISLKPREENSKGKLGGRNPNAVYISKRVIVVGRHPLKGYKGFIKSTTPDGYAFLQLDSRIQECTKILLIDLALLTYMDELSDKRVGEQPGLATTQIPSTSAHAPMSSPVVGLTPSWDPSEISDVLSNNISPAWDPSSRTPPSLINTTRTLHWLDDPALQTFRLKLKIDDPSLQCPYVEFIGVENDSVKVRDKVDIRFYAFDTVSPLLPASEGDLVIPHRGERQGEYFRIVRIEDSVCVVRKPGIKASKSKNPDIDFAISDLIQVYPAVRHW